MKKDMMPRLACFAMALAVIFGGSSLYYGSRAGAYQRYIELQNQRALSSLTEDLDGLGAALAKPRISTASARRSPRAPMSRAAR